MNPSDIQKILSALGSFALVNFWNPAGWMSVAITSGALGIYSDYHKTQVIIEAAKAYAKTTRKTRPNSELKKIKDDAPSWAKQQPPTHGDKDSKSYAKRILDDKYGSGKWKSGPDSEYSQIVKWAQTHFIW